MYRALYRKWRPQRFEDVVGQQAIVTALKNQITAGRVGHAYLFTGVRGTGKTTCAKIFAKAVNCLHPQNGDPCGSCEACRGIDNGSILDVIEMDAASNNGVDDIRDLRDETAYTPSACRYKVYIIDEVHMLSTAAFNALLKTLEEPPAHVIFILATTEIQKVPATILSRCQRYDFARIGPEDIARRVAYIAQQEGLALTADGAELIARLADGALRDALSILDTCAGVATEIDQQVVQRMAGVADRSYLFAISDAIAAQDAAGALAQLAALRQQSVDVKRLAEELIAHYRSLMLAALPGGAQLLSGVSPQEEQQYLQKAGQLGQGEAIRAIRALGGALERMVRGGNQRIELEMALFSLTEAAPRAQQPARQPAQPPAAQAAAQPFAAQPFATAPPAAAFARVGAELRATPTLQLVDAAGRPADPDSVVTVAAVQSLLASVCQRPPQPAPAGGMAGGAAARQGTPQAGAENQPAGTPQAGAASGAAGPAAGAAPANGAQPPAAAPGTAQNQTQQPGTAQPQSGALAPPAEQPLPPPAAEELPPPPPQEADAPPLPQYPPEPPQSAAPAAPAQPAAAGQAGQAAAGQPAQPGPWQPWAAVLKLIQARDPMLYAYLKRSRAYFDGTRVLIDGGKTFRDFIRQNRDSQRLIKKLIREQTGTALPIGPYEPGRGLQSTGSTAEQSLRQLQQLGLQVEIQDSQKAAHYAPEPPGP